MKGMVKYVPPVAATPGSLLDMQSPSSPQTYWIQKLPRNQIPSDSHDSQQFEKHCCGGKLTGLSVPTVRLLNSYVTSGQAAQPF